MSLRLFLSVILSCIALPALAEPAIVSDIIETAANVIAIDKADTVWLLISSALVMLMVPGLAFFYSGMVHSNNVVATLMHSYMKLCVIFTVWVLWGYSFAFGPSAGGLIGDFSYLGLNGVTGDAMGEGSPYPHYIFVVFQGMFAAITAAIITGAFAPTAIGGGIVGVLIQGIKRAAFSNEAGIGSAPIAHSAVKTEKPASEGMVALLEPFTDTVVVCTMTALVLIVTGSWKIDAVVEKESVALYAQPNVESVVVEEAAKGEEFRILSKNEDKTFGEVQRENKESVWVEMETVKSLDGIQKTSKAFEGQFAWFPKLLAIAVLLFAFSTMISWSYYGEQAVNYLYGGNNSAAILLYKLFFCGFVVVGAVASLGNVLKLSDAMLFAMVIPNLIGVYLLLPVVKKELISFRKHVDEIEGK